MPDVPFLYFTFVLRPDEACDATVSKLTDLELPCTQDCVCKMSTLVLQMVIYSCSSAAAVVPILSTSTVRCCCQMLSLY